MMASDNQNHKRQIESALEEIKVGKYSTENINFLKSSIENLMEAKSYETALDLLKQLAIARQVKTTNILWIGAYLKDLYFNEEAKVLKPKFDQLMMEEMLFYYLKSCKLFDPGYNQIKEDIKALKS